ncbi:hypothetical protein [Rhodococcus sp. USK10]|uniref:oxidoreductase n=1 Tax=Rhodococcus sp. USK10 TaxID=2789739 RepID=UPI002151D779|nr:hypothetical protein [Rhodococcus sp. USK10]
MRTETGNSLLELFADIVEVGDDIPLLVRLSATDWAEGGFNLDETVEVTTWLKMHGVDLIDVSTGGNVLAPITAGPGYQVHFAAEIRQRAGIATGAVGLIQDPMQAEQILLAGQADVVLVGRELLRDPNFAIRAAHALRADVAPTPLPYYRAYS